MLNEDQKELRYDYERLKTYRQRYDLIKRYNDEQMKRHNPSLFEPYYIPIIPPLLGRLPFYR